MPLRLFYIRSDGIKEGEHTHAYRSVWWCGDSRYQRRYVTGGPPYLFLMQRREQSLEFSVDGIESQWYLGAETVDPVKLAFESEGLGVLLLGVMIYEPKDVDFNVIQLVVVVLIEVPGYFVVILLVFYQIEMALETCFHRVHCL